MEPERNGTPIQIRPEDISSPADPTDPHASGPQSEPHAPPYRSNWHRPPTRAVVLFLVTCVTVFWAGRMSGPARTLQEALLNCAVYAGALMLTLVFHEMGHFIQSRRYHVPASWPYFIPMPFGFLGTLGAVIIQGRQSGDRKALFDIAITGPLAGLVIALPVAWFSLSDAVTAAFDPAHGGIIFTDPPLMRWMYEVQHGPIPAGHEIALTPLIFAGWVGILITALNLIPTGQLDGGHILSALLRKRSWPVATGLLWAATLYMVLTGKYAYVQIVALLFLFGARHPPTGNDDVPLGWPRIILGWLTLGFIFIGFTMEPIQIVQPQDTPNPPPATAPANPTVASDSAQ
jgi:membrane-associated protease RseP (regulator of RpoE activity)